MWMNKIIDWVSNVSKNKLNAESHFYEIFTISFVLLHSQGKDVHTEQMSVLCFLNT